MELFKNFIIAIIIVGILTRIAYFFFIKKVDAMAAVSLSFLITGLILFPIISVFISFDIAISKYLVAFLIWIIIDFMRINMKGGK
ncbi:MAG: hypothetical protein K1060chlam5_00463 [Candidatus Anoxychlamydiales bacterium]|nr:hypothetical protein [Candidatus Anoxychlamydiales bacterium]